MLKFLQTVVGVSSSNEWLDLLDLEDAEKELRKKVAQTVKDSHAESDKVRKQKTDDMVALIKDIESNIKDLMVDFNQATPTRPLHDIIADIEAEMARLPKNADGIAESQSTKDSKAEDKAKEDNEAAVTGALSGRASSETPGGNTNKKPKSERVSSKDTQGNSKTQEDMNEEALQRKLDRANKKRDVYNRLGSVMKGLRNLIADLSHVTYTDKHTVKSSIRNFVSSFLTEKQTIHNEADALFMLITISFASPNSSSSSP